METHVITESQHGVTAPAGRRSRMKGDRPDQGNLDTMRKVPSGRGQSAAPNFETRLDRGNLAGGAATAAPPASSKKNDRRYADIPVGNEQCRFYLGSTDTALGYAAVPRCAEHALVGKPYCRDHLRLCYMGLVFKAEPRETKPNAFHF